MRFVHDLSMRGVFPLVLPGFLCLGLLASPLVFAAHRIDLSAISSPDAGMSVRTHVVNRSSVLSGFGRVFSAGTMTLRASVTGEIEDSTMQLGQSVSTGQRLAVIGGREFAAQVQQARAKFADAQVHTMSALVAATRGARNDHSSTTQTLLQAEQALDKVKAAEVRARMALGALLQNQVLRAPVSGTVTRLYQVQGSRVTPGMAIVRIEPREGGQLLARFFPSQDAGFPVTDIQPGLRGWFLPNGQSARIPVQIVSVLPMDADDGALPVVLCTEPGSSAQWQPGMAGTVMLIAPHPIEVVPVPTRALILEQGQWWVLVEKDGHWQRQVVTLGASHGQETDVLRGLAAGTRVLVDQAYLKFHQNFGLRYQQPD